MQVYESELITLKIPRSIIDGSDLVLMEFSQCGGCYYLLMHLDHDLRPLFKLLETQPCTGEDAHSGDSKHVSRFSVIDIGHIGVIQDEFNVSLLNWDKIQPSLPIGDSHQSPNLSLLSDMHSENLLTYKGSSSSSFSSIVDQVFETEKGMIHGNRGSISSPKWEGSPIPSNNLKGPVQSGLLDSLRYAPLNHLSSSHASHDSSLLKTNLHSGISGLYYSIEHDEERLQNEYLKEGSFNVGGSETGQLLSSTVSTSDSQLLVEISSTGALKGECCNHYIVYTNYFKNYVVRSLTSPYPRIVIFQSMDDQKSVLLLTWQCLFPHCKNFTPLLG